MNRTFILITLFSLLVLAACVKKEATSQQSIQDIMGKSPETAPAPATQTPVITKNETINQTAPEEKLGGEAPIVNKKCRDSAIVYGGCKWTDAQHTQFGVLIQSSAKKLIPGVWFFITGETGVVKTMKNDGELIAGGSRTYTLNNADLVKELGTLKRVEIYPIEVVNNTQYACENQRVYTIPEAYCHPSEPMKIG